MNKKIYITGLGCISSCGYNNKKLLEDVINGKKNRQAYGLLKDFNATDYLEKKGVAHLNRSTHLLLVGSLLAFKDADLSINESNAENIGVSIGNVFGSLSSIQNFDRATVEEGPRGVKPMQFSNCVKNSEAANISIKYGPKAFNVTLASGMASSLDAIAYSMDMIENEYCDITLAGGVEESCEQLDYGCEKIGIIFKNKDKYGENYGDGNASGIVLGEGTGIIILESEKSVNERKVKTYGRIISYSRRLCYDEDFETEMKKCMNNAIMEAGITTDDINLIIGNFCGVNKLDIDERRSIIDLFNKNDRVGIYAPKMLLGETYSASGALASIIGTLLLNNNSKVPAKSKKIHNGILIDYGEEYMDDMKYVMVNAFDAMGQLITIIIER